MVPCDWTCPPPTKRDQLIQEAAFDCQLSYRWQYHTTQYESRRVVILVNHNLIQSLWQFPQLFRAVIAKHKLHKTALGKSESFHLRNTRFFSQCKCLDSVATFHFSLLTSTVCLRRRLHGASNTHWVMQVICFSPNSKGDLTETLHTRIATPPPPPPDRRPDHPVEDAITATRTWSISGFRPRKTANCVQWAPPPPRPSQKPPSLGSKLGSLQQRDPPPPQQSRHPFVGLIWFWHCFAVCGGLRGSTQGKPMI